MSCEEIKKIWLKGILTLLYTAWLVLFGLDFFSWIFVKTFQTFLEVKADINQVICTFCSTFYVMQKFPHCGAKDGHFSFFLCSCKLCLIKPNPNIFNNMGIYKILVYWFWLKVFVILSNRGIFARFSKKNDRLFPTNSFTKSKWYRLPLLCFAFCFRTAVCIT